MSVHREPNFRIYWETPRLNGPIHAILKHMLLNCFENLCRYLHISPQMTTLPPEPDMESENSSDAEIQSWWSKLEPMLSSFHTACQQCLILGTEVAIDEIMV